MNAAVELRPLVDQQRRPLPVIETPFIEAVRWASQHLDESQLSRVGITSALRGEGRTSLALAMAIVQSEDFERKTLLVELDFDNPSLARSLGVNNEGISELVEGDIPVAQAVQALSPDLLVAVAGRARRSAPGVAHRLVEGGVLANLCAEFDVVVADLPPLLASSLGPQVTAMMQTVLLVVRAGVTPAAQVREAAALLTSEPLVILNDVTSHIPRWARRIAGH